MCWTKSSLLSVSWSCYHLTKFANSNQKPVKKLVVTKGFYFCHELIRNTSCWNQHQTCCSCRFSYQSSWSRDIWKILCLHCLVPICYDIYADRRVVQGITFMSSVDSGHCCFDLPTLMLHWYWIVYLGVRTALRVAKYWPSVIAGSLRRLPCRQHLAIPLGHWPPLLTEGGELDSHQDKRWSSIGASNADMVGTCLDRNTRSDDPDAARATRAGLTIFLQSALFRNRTWRHQSTNAEHDSFKFTPPNTFQCFHPGSLLSMMRYCVSVSPNHSCFTAWLCLQGQRLPALCGQRSYGWSR